MRWVLPPEASYKANFDAAVFEGSGSAGIGVVCRDHTGSIIAALSQKIGSWQSFEMVEALAAWRAIIFTTELNLFNVIFEGDYLRVLQALNSAGRCHIMFGLVIDETKRLGG